MGSSFLVNRGGDADRGQRGFAGGTTRTACAYFVRSTTPSCCTDDSLPSRSGSPSRLFYRQSRMPTEKEDIMKHHINRTMTLGDAIATVARFARDDHEVGVVVADFIKRGIIRFPSRGRHSSRGSFRRRAA